MRNIKYRDIFANNSPEALIEAVRNGFPVYREDFYDKYGHESQTFFEAAVRYGTPELVKACVEMGADVNCADPQKARQVSPRAMSSSLLAAMSSYNPETLRALFECGARTGILNDLLWDLERNFIPEAERDDEKAKEIKRRLDAGAEILKILREAGFRVPGLGWGGVQKSGADDAAEMSFYAAGTLSSTEMKGYGDDDEDDDDRNAEKKHRVWEKWEKEDYFEDYSDGGDDAEDRFDRYCEGLAEFMGENSFPSHGTRPGALWHAASPGASRQMIEAGADVNAADAAGWTALHHIAYHCVGDYYFNPNAMIRTLLDHGADVNRLGRYDMTALDLAAMRVRHHPETLETVKLLLMNGADAADGGSGWGSALYWISEYWYVVRGKFEKIVLREILREIRRFAQPDKAGAEKNPPLCAADIDLMTAAFWGTPEDLAPILARGADVNARSGAFGFTPLIFASIWNYASASKFLIENGADVNAKSVDGNTALMFAIKTCDWDMVVTLVEMGARLNDASASGYTPIMHAINSGCGTDLLKFLIQRGADVNAKDKDGNTPLNAFADLDFDKAEALLNAGANVNDMDADGRTPLDVILDCEWGDRQSVIRLLLARGADPSLLIVPEKTKEEETEEGIAGEFSKYGLKPRARFGDIFADNGAAVIAKAVTEGLSLKFEDCDGLDFYRAALRYGAPEVVKACLDAGANVNEGWEGGDWVSYQAFPQSWPIYHAIDGRNAEAVKTLVEAGADLSDVERLRWRLRVNVFPEGNRDDEAARKFRARLDTGAKILKILRGAGACVQCEDHEGRSLTYVHVDRDDKKADNADRTTRNIGIDTNAAETKLTDLLRVAGACPSRDGKGARRVTAMRRAASPAALKLLLDAGTDVNARDNDGRTALHFIARDQYGYFDPAGMVRLLIGAGADVNARDKAGITPLMLAAAAGAESFRADALETIRALAEAGADFGAKDKKKRTVLSWIEESHGTEALKKILYGELADMIGRTFKPSRKKTAARHKREADANLMIASCFGSAEEIEKALESGANINVRGNKGHAPLIFASVFNTPEAVKFLIGRGADLKARNFRGETVLHVAVQSDKADPGIVRALAEAGMDVNITDDGGYTPLMLAARVRNTGSIAKILVDAGADIGIKRKDDEGSEKDALSIAMNKKHFHVVRALLAAGAELPAPNEDAPDSDGDDEYQYDEDETEEDGKGEVLSKTAIMLRQHGLKIPG